MKNNEFVELSNFSNTYGFNTFCENYFNFKKFFNNKSRNYEIKVGKKILGANDIIARNIRRNFLKKMVFVINVMSSPGSGKTTFLQETIPLVISNFKCAIIVGDICTANDANRLMTSGVEVVQINTDKFGGDCHLSASIVEKAINEINIDKIDLLFIENIGNLVCPAEFDLGEDIKITVLSVTEGEDKPAKYPLMFKESDAIILNKIDLLPYLDFDKKASLDIIKSINSNAPIFEISSKTKKGFSEWVSWLNKMITLKTSNLKFK